MLYLEYIQTDGYCYFDTGLIPDINTKIEAKMMIVNDPVADDTFSWCGLFGCQNTDNTGGAVLIRHRSTGGDLSIFFNNEWTASGKYVTGETHTYTLDKDYFKIDGTTIISTNQSSLPTCNNTLFISAIHNTEWVNGDGVRPPYRSKAARFEWFKVYNGSTLVGDFRPAVDNGSVGFYDEVTQTFKQKLGTGTPTAGPSFASITATASKDRLDATGETITIEVATENAWTVSGNTWLTLSSTGDTSGDTITATAPNYTGTTNRDETLWFIDSVTGDEAELTITQKKVQVGQPMYLGGDEITEFYLGGDPISEMYLGETLVYSSGPFEGLKATPKNISFNVGNLTASIKIKSSESWSLTTPAWITASVSTGDTGETVVTLTATAQTATTTGSVEVVSTNYSASVSVNYSLYQPVSYVYATTHNGYVQANHIDTGIAHTASTMTVEIEYYGLGNFSDRMVGYSAGDVGCSSDNNDFRLFGYQGGTYDYMTYRKTFGGAIYNGYRHFTIGDCFCYDNENEIYKCQDAAIGSVPSPNCHILVDVSYIKVKSVKIMDGNTVLFDGVAATLEGQAGIYDKVSGTLKYNSNVPMSYDA